MSRESQVQAGSFVPTSAVLEQMVCGTKRKGKHTERCSSGKR